MNSYFYSLYANINAAATVNVLNNYIFRIHWNTHGFKFNRTLCCIIILAVK